MLIGGCGAKPKEASVEPEKDKIAIIDMDKASASHPKQAERTALAKELQVLLAKQQFAAGRQSQATAVTDGTDGNPAALDNGAPVTPTAELQAQFQEKMLAKQAELNAALTTQQSDAKAQAAAQYNDYVAKLNEEYQSQLFDIELKRKTLQLSKEELTALQAKEEKINQEKAAKLQTKETELTELIDQKMTKAKQAASAELDQYGLSLHEQVAKEALSASQALAVAVPPQSTESSAETLFTAEDAAQLDQLKGRIDALDALIFQDIENLCGKTAQLKGYSIVITSVAVNLKADDITDEVIRQFKK